MLIQDMLQHCVNGNVEEAYKTMAHLWKLGYSADDIITIIFRVCKNQNIPEFLKLEFIKVWRNLATRNFINVAQFHSFIWPCITKKKKQLNTLSLLQEIGYTHMRIAEGVQSLLQMSALLARLCKKSAVPGIKG